MIKNELNAAGSQRSITPGIDRRIAPRAELDVGVGFYSDTNFYTGFTEDVSEGGLFVATHVLEPIGTVLKLTFTLPGGPQIIAVGVVRWVRDPRNHDADTAPGMGVQFKALQQEHLHLIREFVALREPLFYVD